MGNKNPFNLNSQGDEKFELFPKGSTTFKIWEIKPLFIVDHEHVMKFAVGWLAFKLCLKESIILWNDMFALLNE